MFNLSRLAALLVFAISASAQTNLNVRSFGATGNGKTKDTAAFQSALDVCAAAGGGTVIVSNGSYLIGSIVLGTNTTLRLDGKSRLIGSPDITDYPMTHSRWEGEYSEVHRALISAEKTGNIAIKGKGFIFGPPPQLSSLRSPRGPSLIEFIECEDITLEGFTTQYQQMWNIHPLLCKRFTARNLTIRSVGAISDGIDVDSCSGVLIEHCDINTGDDAIALKSGRGLAAATLARPTEDVVIRDCTLFSSIYAGIAFGTELSGGLRNIRVDNCILSGRQNGIYMKSRDGRGATIENVTGENLTILNAGTFLGINLVNKGIQADDPVPGDVDKWTLMRNVKYNNITVRNVKELVQAKDVSPARPVENLTLTNIKGDCANAFNLANMTNVVLAGIEVTGYSGALVTKTNVTGSGLEQGK